MTQRRSSGLAIGLWAVLTTFGWAAEPAGPGHPAAPATPKASGIHQEVDVKASPQRVYEALLESAQFSAFTARTAEIDRAVGGAFSLFNGHIIGRNVELVPNKRIVQAWRVVTWPEGLYSIARFELQPQGAGTHLVFDHTGFPDGERDHLAAGWEENYWTLLKKYLEKSAG